MNLSQRLTMPDAAFKKFNLSSVMTGKLNGIAWEIGTAGVQDFEDDEGESKFTLKAGEALVSIVFLLILLKKAKQVANKLLSTDRRVGCVFPEKETVLISERVPYLVERAWDRRVGLSGLSPGLDPC